MTLVSFSMVIKFINLNYYSSGIIILVIAVAKIRTCKKKSCGSAGNMLSIRAYFEMVLES